MAINLMDQVRRFRRARQTFLPAQVLQAAGKGLQFGLMGKVPTDDETDMRGPQMEALQSQLEAVTELSKESVALQALQASFMKVAQLSLFNFLR